MNDNLRIAQEIQLAIKSIKENTPRIENPVVAATKMLRTKLGLDLRQAYILAMVLMH